jgi:hypothetical protein
MDVCERLFCVCVVLCVDSGLATDWSPTQGVLPTLYRLRNRKATKVHKGCRAMNRLWSYVGDYEIVCGVVILNLFRVWWLWSLCRILLVVKLTGVCSYDALWSPVITYGSAWGLVALKSRVIWWLWRCMGVWWPWICVWSNDEGGLWVLVIIKLCAVWWLWSSIGFGDNEPVLSLMIIIDESGEKGNNLFKLLLGIR